MKRLLHVLLVLPVAHSYAPACVPLSTRAVRAPLAALCCRLPDDDIKHEPTVRQRTEELRAAIDDVRASNVFGASAMLASSAFRATVSRLPTPAPPALSGGTHPAASRRPRCPAHSLSHSLPRLRHRRSARTSTTSPPPPARPATSTRTRRSPRPGRRVTPRSAPPRRCAPPQRSRRPPPSRPPRPPRRLPARRPPPRAPSPSPPSASRTRSTSTSAYSEPSRRPPPRPRSSRPRPAWYRPVPLRPRRARPTSTARPARPATRLARRSPTRSRA